MNRNYLLFCLFCISARFVFVAAIVGGELAQVDQFPYQVALMRHGREYICCGGIIGDKFILTAAHCVAEDDGSIEHAHFSILAGTNDLQKIDEPAVVIDVKKIFIPKSFNPNQHNGVLEDIAVLQLYHSLELSIRTHLKKLQLPENKSYYRKIAKIAGWGWNSIIVNETFITGNSSDTHLRFVETLVLGRGLYGYPEQTVTVKQMCARTKQRRGVVRGVCYGDSGCPLVYRGTTIIGIQSIGPWDCSEKEVGAIYTRVSGYLEFIYAAMNGEHRDDIKTFERD